MTNHPTPLVKELMEALAEFLSAEDEVEKEARRVESGGGAWSAAPVARRIHAVNALRVVLARAKKKGWAP